MLGKWNGTFDGTTWGPKNGTSQDDGNGLYTPQSGYQWLPHRAVTQATADTAGRVCGPTPPVMTDQPGDIAKTASAKPDRLVLADYNIYSGRSNAYCPGATTPDCGVAANHGGSDNRALPVVESNCIVALSMPDLVRTANPEEIPLGMNRARIDARTIWVPFQDWNHFRWSPYYNFYSF